MKLDEILAEWVEDCSIDQTQLGNEAVQCPILHAKYLRYLADAKAQVKKYENKLLEMQRIKTKYYNGLMTKEELSERGWPQYQRTKPLKGELIELLRCDPDIIDISNYYDYAMHKVEALKEIMKEIGNRNFHIKSSMEWIKWTSGNI